MLNRELIHQYNKAVSAIYLDENLKCVRGLDDSYILNGKNIVKWHGDIIKNIRGEDRDLKFMKIFDDLLLTSDECMYFTAQLFLYRPFINNPVKDAIKPRGWEHWVYPNKQNLEAKRYNMFLDICSEKYYNFWDRIGDLIAMFFPNIINPKNVYFPKAIDQIPREYRENDHYKWLFEFKNKEYVELNNIRKEVVHYTSTDTHLKYDHLTSKPNDEKTAQEWFDKRYEIVNFYKKHLDHSVNGFYECYSLLEIISKSLANLYDVS